MTRSIALRTIALIWFVTVVPFAAADDDPRWMLSIGVDANTLDGMSGSILGVDYDYSGTTRGKRIGAAFRVYGPVWVEAGYRKLGKLQSIVASCNYLGPAVQPTICEPISYEFTADARTLGLHVESDVGSAWSAFFVYNMLQVNASRIYGPGAVLGTPGSHQSSEDMGQAFGVGIAFRFGGGYSVALSHEGIQGLDNLQWSEPAASTTLELRYSF